MCPKCVCFGILMKINFSRYPQKKKLHIVYNLSVRLPTSNTFNQYLKKKFFTLQTSLWCKQCGFPKSHFLRILDYCVALVAIVIDDSGWLFVMRRSTNSILKSDMKTSHSTNFEKIKQNYTDILTRKVDLRSVFKAQSQEPTYVCFMLV